MSKTIRNLLALLLCLILCACLAPAAFADGRTTAAFQTAIDRGDESFTLTGDMEISGDVFLNAPNTALVVPSGKTLTVNGGISELSDLVLAGGDIIINGGVFRVNGNFTHTGGTVSVSSGFNLFPAKDVLPDKLDVFQHSDGSDGTSLLFIPTDEDSFASAVDAANSLPDKFTADITVKTGLTLSGEHILRHRTELRINCGLGGSLKLEQGAMLRYHECGGNMTLNNPANAANTEASVIDGMLDVNNLSVGPGCTLIVNDTVLTHSFTDNGDVTVNGFLYARNEIKLDSTLELNGMVSAEHDAFDSLDALRAKINFGDDSTLDISYDLNNEQDVITELGRRITTAHLRKSVWALFDWTTTKTVTVPAQARLCVPGERGIGLTIGAGKTLTVKNGGEIMARGAHNGAVIKLEGKLVNDGLINLFWYDNNLAEIAMGENGSYSGSGQILRDERPYTIQPYNEEFSALRDAIGRYMAEGGWNEYDLRNKGAVSFAGDLFIPDGFIVRAAGTDVTVPEGSALIIAGTLNCDRLHNNSLVNIYGHGQLNIWRDGSVLNGMINCFDEGGLGIPVPSEDDLQHIHREGNARVLLHYRADAGTLESVKADCDTLPDRYGFTGVIHPTEDLTLRKNMVFDRTGLILENVSLTIPSGKTLAASVEVANGSLIVKKGGSLVNTDFIRLRGTAGPQTVGRLVVESGGIFSGGRIMVNGTDDPDAQIQGLDLSAYSKFVRPNGMETIYTYTDGVFDDFVAALEDENVHYFELKELGRFVLRDCAALNLRDRDDFYIETWGTTLVVPSGQLLTIPAGVHFSVHELEIERNAFVALEEDAELDIYDAFALDGRITADRNARMGLPVANTGAIDTSRIFLSEDTEVTFKLRPEDGEELLRMKAEADSLEAPYRGSLEVFFPWTPTEDISFDGSTSFDLNGSHDCRGSLTVGDGVTVSINSWASAHCADVTVQNGGTLVNNGDFYFNGESAEMPTGVLCVEEGGRYGGIGRILISAGDDHDSHIVGIDGLTKTALDDGSAYRLTGEVIDALYEAAEQGYDYFNLRDLGRLVLPRDLTIPGVMYVEGWGTQLVVPEGVTLNVAGVLDLSAMTLDGVVNISKEQPEDERWPSINVSDHMALNGEIKLGIDARADLPGRDVRGSLDRIHFYSENYHEVCLHYFTESADEVYELQADTDPLSENFHLCIHILFPWVLDRDVVFNSTAGLNVDGGWTDGSIYVPAGRKLTIGTFCNINNTTVTVAGELFNSGSMEFQCDYGSNNAHYGVLEIADGGTYRGGGILRFPKDDFYDPEQQLIGLPLYDEGTFRAYDEGWCVAYVYIGADPQEADLVLPAAMTEIESEAFADGAFRSVYIPESVYFIDDSAFDGIDGLTVYGHYDSEAFYFAERHGFLFVAVA